MGVFDIPSHPLPNKATSTTRKSFKCPAPDILVGDDKVTVDPLRGPPLKKAGIISLESDLHLSDSDTESLPDILETDKPVTNSEGTPVLPATPHLLDTLRPSWYKEFPKGSYKEIITLIMQDASALGHIHGQSEKDILPQLEIIHREFLSMLKTNFAGHFHSDETSSNF